ncbi:hypothetical protein OpiT1DRAFT_02465 [Opitutaceae bacterium TAV1]|nr:hypothetical protein OpiT1DRAFT_02465 [Opitutaceae bacterium TAV1]
MNPLKKHICCIACFLWALFPSGVVSAPVTVLSETFGSHGEGAPPSGWTTTGQWNVRSYGNNKAVVNEDATSSGTNRSGLSRTFSPVSDSWSVDFSYDWRYGGGPSHGGYQLIVDCDLLDQASNQGYRIRVHQGNGNNPANTEKVIRIFRIDNGIATLIAEGRGYNTGGWNPTGSPRLKQVRLTRDARNGRLTASYDPGTGMVVVASGIDAGIRTLNQIVFQTTFGAAERLQLDNIRVVRPGEFVWGINGHIRSSAPSYSSAVPLDDQLGLINELGADYYRVGVSATTDAEARLDQLLVAADLRGIRVLPILFSPVNMLDIQYTPQEIYTAAYNRGRAFAQKYQGVFTHIELENELDNRCILAGRSGELPGDYDADKALRCLNVLKGLSDGVRAGDPAVRRVFASPGGWYHYGFVDLAVAFGIEFEILGWHWYTDSGSPSRVIKKLSDYGKPVWITETNRRYGSLVRESVLSDDFHDDVIGQAPPGWTASGNWKVRQYGSVKGVSNEDASGPQSLSRAISPAVSDSWEAVFDYDWRYGGGPGYGSHNLTIDCDMLDASDNGYRVRVRQGNGNNPANDDTIISIYRLDAGIATLLAHGPGYNQQGFGNGDPALKRIRFRRDGIDTRNNLRVDDGAGGGAFATIIVTDTSHDTFDKMAITVRGYGATERPLLDNIGINVYRHDEDTQAERVAEFLHEMWNFPATENFPGVQAVFLYELLDEPNRTAFSDEAGYGVCTIRRDEAGQWSFGARKTAFDVYREAVAGFGSVPSLHGDTIVDDSYLAPVTRYSSPAAWLEDFALPGSFFGGYRHDNNANKGHYVRFYPAILTTGNHVVSIHFPPDAANAAVVPVRIKHADGITTVTVDQRTNPDGWINLGTYFFNAWQPGRPYGATAWENSTDAVYVEVDNTGTSGRVIVDAVKFHPIP